jgi:cellulose biosynthesis protein BcsQ
MPTIQASITLVQLDTVKKALRRRLQLIENGDLLRKIIVIVNGKGGVGKSSTAAALAVALAAIGKKTLLIEMDEQGNNCEDLGITKSALDDNGAAQAAAILEGKPLVPTGTARPNLYVVPGGTELENVVEELYVQRRIAGAQGESEDRTAWMGMYAAAIDPLREEFDCIILDVAPGSDVLQLQALTSGDMVLIPSKSDPSSRKGLRVVARRFVTALDLNPLLRLLGVVLFSTNTSATKVQKNIKEQLERDLQGTAPVFDQAIRHVEAAAVKCRELGKVPQELRNSKDVDPKLLPSIRALAGDYQSLAMEVVQTWFALDDEADAA